jgi:hypothetical protein
MKIKFQREEHNRQEKAKKAYYYSEMLERGRSEPEIIEWQLCFKFAPDAASPPSQSSRALSPSGSPPRHKPG